MHKLDPIERLPDGSLFRLTPGQLRSVRGLTKRCCNFSGGDCLLLDGACPQYTSRSLLCRWFRRAVLPQQEAAPLRSLRHGHPRPLREGKILSRLRQGGSPSAEGKILPQMAIRRRQFGGEKPLNGKPSRTAEAARQYDFPRSPQIAFYLSTFMPTHLTRTNARRRKSWERQLDYEKNQADPREQKHSAESACSLLLP